MFGSEKPVAALVLGLMGGILILLGSLVMSMFVFAPSNSFFDMSGGMGMMGMSGMMGTSLMTGVGLAFSLIGVSSGIVVILGSLMLYNRPSEGQLWGALIIAFSMLSLLGGMGGFLVGLILGVLGGVFGLASRPPTLSVNPIDAGPKRQGSSTTK